MTGPRVNRYLLEEVFEAVGRGIGSVSELVEDTGLAPSMVMEILRRLESEGMLDQVAVDPDDPPRWGLPLPVIPPPTLSQRRYRLWDGSPRGAGPYTFEELVAAARALPGRAA